MTADDVIRISEDVAAMARRVGGRLRLDRWKLEQFGLNEAALWRVKDKLHGTVDFDWPEH